MVTGIPRNVPDILHEARLNIASVVDEDIDVASCFERFSHDAVDLFLRPSYVQVKDARPRVLEVPETLFGSTGSRNDAVSAREDGVNE